MRNTAAVVWGAPLIVAFTPSSSVSRRCTVSADSAPGIHSRRTAIGSRVNNDLCADPGVASKKNGLWSLEQAAGVEPEGPDGLVCPIAGNQAKRGEKPTQRSQFRDRGA